MKSSCSRALLLCGLFCVSCDSGPDDDASSGSETETDGLTGALDADSEADSAAEPGSPVLVAPQESASPGYPAWADHDLPDPFAIVASNGYNVFGTTCGLSRICYYQGATAKTYNAQLTQKPNPMPTAPPWVNTQDWALWAPSVVKVGSTYVMYFAGTSWANNNAKCIGLAKSFDGVDGPYQPEPKPLVCDSTYWNIDPSPVVSGGKRYLVWRSDDAAHVTGKIVAQEMNATGTGFVGSRVTLLTGAYAWEDDAANASKGLGPLENPSMHVFGGKHILVYSANNWKTANYAMGIATCSGPLGPCTKNATTQPWLNKSWTSPFIETTSTFVGAGGGELFENGDGKLYLVFHAYHSTGSTAGPRVPWVYRVALGFGYNLVQI